MNYAVIRAGGKQYRVSEGEVFEFDKISKDTKKVFFDEVLLLVANGNVKIGKPLLKGEKIEGEVLDNIKGDKLRVSKYKAKVRYRRVIGFRPSFTKVKIGKISASKK